MRISTRVAAVGAAAAIAATSLVAMLPAGAAPSVDPTTTTTSVAPSTTVAGPEQVNSNVTGTLTVNGASALNITVPTGSAFKGTFDHGTGAINGNFSFPADTLKGLALTITLGGNPIDAKGDLNYVLSSATPATGTVDPVTHAVTLTDVESLTLKSIDVTSPAALAVPFAAGCVVGPITMKYTGTYDPATGNVDITSAAAPIAQIPAGACGEAAGTDLTVAVNALLANATATAHLKFVLGVETITPPTPTTTTVAPKAKPTAPAAKATPGTPKFTG